MKTFTKIQILHPDSVDLEINEEPAEALGLREDVHLTGFALARSQSSTKNDLFKINPTQSFVLSPFPLASWGRLLRASLTYSPVTGGLAAIQKALRKLNLICHHTHSANGIDLERSQIMTSETPAGISLQRNHYQLDNLIIPSSLIVFEIPVLEEASQPDLHSSLLKCVQNPPSHKHRAASALQDALTSALKEDSNNHIRVRVDWVSSMETLNRLAGWKLPENHERSLTKPECDEALTTHSQNIDDIHYTPPHLRDSDQVSHLSRARARKKIPVKIKEDKLTVSMKPWKRLIWPYRDVIPDTMTWKAQDLILAIGHVDLNERILLWDLYRSPANRDLGPTVIEFEFLSPAGLVESIWWEWVFEELESAGADILAVSSSSRTLGHWSRLHITAIFPINFKSNHGQPGDISTFINCFRVLQGVEGEQLHGAKKTSFTTRLRTRLDEASEDWAHLRQPRLDSTIRNVRVWDCKQGTVTRDYTRRFKNNPFSFTSPLTKETHDRLYQDTEEIPYSKRERTRANLADRVVQSLTAGENVAIVGAHRSGKTSVLNLVQQRLATPLAKDTTTVEDTPTVLPIRVEASLIIPQGFFAEVYHQVSAATLSLYKKLFAGRLKKKRFFETSRPSLVEGLETKLSVKLPIFEFSGTQKRRLKSAVSEKNLRKALELFSDQLSNSAGSGAGEITVMMLERQISSLVEALNSDSDGLRFVVIIDEVHRIYGTEFKPILQGWRHVMESSHFDKIRWLISASRPIEEQDLYSPITNVFKEYNVGSLREEETSKLLEAFGALDKNEPADDLADQLTPVLMYNAGIFIARFSSRLPYFVQVICYHLFDRSTRYTVPLINRDLCYKIISTDVLNEITDYLEQIWVGLPPAVSRPLERKLKEAPDHPKAFLDFMESSKFQDYQYSARTKKVLIRAGLKGDDKLIIAPLAAYWLITQYIEFPESQEAEQAASSSEKSF